MADNILRRFVRIFFDRDSAKKVEDQLNESLTTAGKKSGESFLREIKEVFTRRTADLKVLLAKGIIDPAEFRKQSDLAAREFNAGLLKGMDEARRAGTMTEREFIKLSRQLKLVGDDGATAFDRIRGKLLTVGAAIGSFFALSRITQWGRDAVVAATQARQAMAQLEAAVKSTGGASGFTTAQLTKQAEALERLSMFSKEAVQGGLTRLLTYTAIQGEMFKRASVAALDMAQRLGIDVASAAERVGNALNYPTKALNSLTKQGFRFSEQQQQQIKDMERTGNIAGAQAIILNELELAYGGAALAASNAAGPWRQFGLEVGRLKQSLGETILRMLEQTGVVGRLTSVVTLLADNTAQLVSVVVSLGKALVVAGLLSGMARLVTIVRAADLAFKGWRATLASMQLLMGPKGWFTLGVLGLTIAFEKLGSAARKAAADAKAAIEDFSASAQSFTDRQIEASTAVLDAQREALRVRIAGLKEAMTGEERLKGGLAGRRRRAAELVQAEQDLNTVMEKGNALLEERRRRSQQRTTDSGAGAGAETGRTTSATPDTTESDKARKQQEQEEQRLADKREAMQERERERLRMLAEEQATYDALALADRQEAFRQQQAIADANAQAEATRKAVAVGAVQVTTEANAALYAYNREQFIANALLQAGAVAGTDFGNALADAARQSFEAANSFSSPWQEAMKLIEEGAQGAIGIVGQLHAAWRDGGIASVAALAKAKIKENIAAAIENAARALAAFGLGNPGAGAKYYAAAAKHTAAAAAWKVAGSAAGGSGAAATAGGGGGTASSQSVSNMTPRGPEVTIVLDGPGFDAMNPKVQQVILGSIEQGRQRQGDNAQVRVIRSGR